MKNKYKQVLKLIFSLLLLILVLGRIEIPLLLSNIKQISLLSIIMILLFSLSSITLAARRSQVIVQEKCAVMISLLESYKYYLIGMFYNNLLPTSIGGDIFRIYLINQKAKQIYRVSSTVFIERLTGFFATLSLSLLAALVLYRTQHQIVYVYYLSSLFIVACLVSLLFFSPSFWLFTRKIIRFFSFKQLFESIEKFISIVQEYRLDKGLLLKMIVLSLLYQMSDILVSYLFSLTIGFNVDFIFFLLFIPLIYIITLIPISVNGLGVRENAMVYLFSTVGAVSHKALLLSLLIYLDRVIKGVLGGILSLIITAIGTGKGRSEDDRFS